MQKDWNFNPEDEKTIKTFSSWLPEKLFDIHAHLYRKEMLAAPQNHLVQHGPEESSPKTWRELLEPLVGKGRLSGALFMPMISSPHDRIKDLNTWTITSTTNIPETKTLVLVTPDMSSTEIEPFLSLPHFAGFKPYHLYATTHPTFNALPADYIPEWVWPLAHEHQLVITIHLVRSEAMADPANLKYLRNHCEKFPDARVILAHCGRAFHAPNAKKGVVGLEEIRNIWFDTAAICEAEPIETLLNAFGPRRILWGSDFPVSQIPGRCVTTGNGFYWLHPNTTIPGQGSLQFLPIVLENLRAHQKAAKTFGLNKEDLTDIFYENAQRLLHIRPEFDSDILHLYQHAKERIPGGTQLLSKRPEMFAPNQWPAYFREARGCETWDTDGRHYYDMSHNGISSCLLGFRDPDVTTAVQRRVALGSMSTLNPPEEVELADLLCKIHPWAEQVRFARCGGEACAVAIRISRATTNRSLVAFCGYHGWQDWYLAANLGESDALQGHLLPGLESFGVPKELRGTALTFRYNHPEEFQTLIKKYGDKLAAVIMEPCRSEDPDPGFLENIRNTAHHSGALLIFDEITIGWRMCLGGAHRKFGVSPDIAVFAKAMGNGHPIAAIIGTRNAMDGAHRSFISSTYWTESVGPVAALATIQKMEQIDLPAYIARIGSRVIEIWKEYGKKYNISIDTASRLSLPKMQFNHEKSDILRTLFTQYMLDRGFLATTAFSPTLAHNDRILDLYEKAIEEVFSMIARDIDSKDPEDSLRGPVAHTGFHRLAK